MSMDNNNIDEASKLPRISNGSSSSSSSRRSTVSPVPVDGTISAPSTGHGQYDKVITAVRARPLNSHDGTHAKDIVRYFGDQKRGLGIVDPTNQEPGAERMFQFDHTFWSVDRTKTEYFAGQDQIFESIGMPILETCLKGVNCSLFAYGQTGSGKTYTMMGGDPATEDAGVIPRLCRKLLEILQEEKTNGGSLCKTDVRISYLEIYNEKAFDLLSENAGIACRVREQPETGAYVENLVKAPVTTYSDVANVLREGGNRRHVAATLMNSESSRSHAVFTLFITQNMSPPGESSDELTEGVVRKSKVSLVDLAGSERMSTTGASGDRLREASNINRSLSVLGDVIKALSDKSRLGNNSRTDFVPYRNSILTWLLKDSLGGNSRTTMLATVSPTDSSYNESINTLRYIERTKLILNNVSVNVNRSENARINNLLKQISDLETKYAELQSHQMEREQAHRDDIEKMQTEFESQFTEQLKVLAGELERHYSRQAHTQIMEAGIGRGMSFQEATCFDSSDEGKTGAGSSSNSPGRALLSPSLPATPEHGVGLVAGEGDGVAGVSGADREQIIAKYEEIVKGKDATISNYEKVLSTSKSDEDAMLSSLKTMIATLKEQVDTANGRYDTLVERYREFSSAVDVERKDIADVNSSNQQLASDLTKLKLESARRDRELHDKSKDVELMRGEVERWKVSHSETTLEHNKVVANLEDYIQDLIGQKAQVAELESQLDIEKYGNSLKTAMVQDLNLHLAQEQASNKAKLDSLTQEADFQKVKLEELSRGYEDRLLEQQRAMDGLHAQNAVLEAANDRNMVSLQEVMDTMRGDQEKAISDKNSELFLVSEKLSDCTKNLASSQEQFVAYKEMAEAEWGPIVLCFETICEETKKLKQCLKTNNIDDVIPFLEETRRCYKGGDIKEDEKREEVLGLLSPVYSAYRDIAMQWMKHTVGVEKDYDYKELAEALVLAKVEIAQSQYELENMKYMVKSGETDPTRGISAMWGSIGARGRSYLFEDKCKGVDPSSGQAEENGQQDQELAVGGGHSSQQPSEPGVAVISMQAGAENEEYPCSAVADPTPSRWSLWKGGKKNVNKSTAKFDETSSGESSHTAFTITVSETNTDDFVTTDDFDSTSDTVSSAEGESSPPKAQAKGRWGGLWA